MKRVLNKLIQKKYRKLALTRLHDFFFSSYYQKKNLSICPLFNANDNIVYQCKKSDLIDQWEHIREHEFNILGSGYINVNIMDRNVPASAKANYEQIIRDRLPRVCYKDAKRIVKLIDKDWYELIDWSKDYKSGYYFDNRLWYLMAKVPQNKGVDIKVPWEIGRLQHLPMLAIMNAEIESTSFIEEYQCELLDFIAQNPLRFGVQSTCAMDMGIRVANIVLSYSLFVQQGVHFSYCFQNVLANYIYGVCEHIYNNLERNEKGLNNNHYTANLIGIIFGSIFLKDNRHCKNWLDFASNELLQEFDTQYYKEGTNKEGSTAYHVFNTEMFSWGFALLAKEDLLCNLDYNKLFRAGEFIEAIIRPDGTISLIGDNDSGYIFKLFCDNCIGNCNVLSTKILVNSFFSKYDIKQNNDEYALEKSILNCWISKVSRTPDIQHSCYKIVQIEEKPDFRLLNKRITEIDDVPIGYANDVTCISFPEFGLYIWKSEHMYMCISMSNICKETSGGHNHNDNLSYELFVEGKSIYMDPGTNVYTSDFSLRNAYRSAENHNGIWTGEEPNRFLGVFSLERNAQSKVYKFNDEAFIGEQRYGSTVQVREIYLDKKMIKIYDYCNKDIKANGVVPLCYRYGEKGE